MEETNAAVETLEPTDLEDLVVEVGSEELSEDAFTAIGRGVFLTQSSFEQLKSLLANWPRVEKSAASKNDAKVLEGYCALVAGDEERADDCLLTQKSSSWGAYHLARSYGSRGRVDEALAVARAGAKKHADFLPLLALLVELAAKAGEFDEAKLVLERVKELDGETARYHFARAGYLTREGDYSEAIDAYRRAIAIEPKFTEALFRLGYLLEIHGSDADEANDEAVAAYEACMRSGPVHVNAVINLGLLYEDRERYHDAIKCFETVLLHYPNHERAKLYLVDAQSSTTMFYDREQEKKADRQSQVLKIPVTDFELSVRSRNCLQKMNIRSLGDLIMKSEQELLAYKNFGETSLEEIKNMLNQKGLRLGQGLEDGGREPQHGRNPLEATADPSMLDRPIEELELSVRSRRCMERLGVRSIRDLINKTEVELMSAKNFGMTSLNEIKRKLSELGMSLRS